MPDPLLPVPLPVPELTAEHLRAHPVWAFLTDDEGEENQDESFVKPLPAPPSVGSYGSYVLSATFTLREGDQIPGAIQLDQLGNKRHFTPILIHAAGKQLDPLDPDVEKRLTRLRKTPGGPPVRWVLDITLPGDAAPLSRKFSRFRAIRILGMLAKLVLLRFTPRGR